MASTMKEAAKQAVKRANKVANKLTEAAKETEKKVTEIFSPMQAIGQFASKLDKERKDGILPLWDELLDEFTQEGNSKLSIGNTLIKCENLLGDVWSSFLEVVQKVLRRDRATCYVYIGTANSFNFAFAKNVVVKNALLRIWDAKGAFDSKNGKALPVVEKAIKACNGIPETTDSQTCEVWAQVFVDTVDEMVRGKRKAQVDRTWDAETYKKNHERVVKTFTSFIGNKNVTSPRQIVVLRDILLAAMEPKNMGSYGVNAAFTAAQKELSKRNALSKELKENQSEGTIAEARASA